MDKNNLVARMYFDMKTMSREGKDPNVLGVWEILMSMVFFGLALVTLILSM